MEGHAADVHPPKRVKLDTAQADGAGDDVPMALSPRPVGVVDDGAKEREVGITAFVDGSRSLFQGILKKRYTDFLVNEILPGGTVLHLRSMDAKGLQPHAPHNNGSERTAQGTSEHIRHEAAPSDPSPAEYETPREAETTANTKASDATGEDSSGLQNSEVPDEDRAKLVEYFSEETATQIISLYESILRNPGRKSREFSTVRTPFTSDRSLRSQIHQDIRRIFHSKIDSKTDNEGVLVLTATAPSSNNGRNRAWAKPNEKSSRPGKLGWLDRGGEYVHFTLYKENKDTLEVISYLTKQLRTNNKAFQFAGTKDRRAVTVQRVSAYRVEAERLASLNRSLRYAAVGDFEYQKHGLELGDLTGNEFVVTLRDCHLVELVPGLNTTEEKAAIQSYLSQALRQLHEHGFLNYYGLQRFGTFATRTDVVGLKILKEDFKGACDAILEFSPVALNSSESQDSGVLVGQDDRSRAEGINIWRTTGRINDALDKVPRKFSAETNLIRHLGKHPQDYLGALLGIQRNLRLLYVHAYQSFVWNLAAGERWRLFGGKVVEGDLVLVHEHKEKHTDNEPSNQTVDADGEPVIAPSGDDRAYDVDDMFERARALTAAEAESGQYSIFDIVLPLPGFDVVYPANASGEWYKTFMASDAGGGLDPYRMRRKQKDFSLSGGYRKVVARIGETFEVSVHEYGDGEGDRQFVETDMERILREKADVVGVEQQQQRPQSLLDGAGAITTTAQASGSGNDAETAHVPPQHATKFAAVLKFQLGSSQYATMALRELSKGGIQAHKAEFTGGR
ncbi:hypothetical protein AYL99_00214 [Fonsecaea erecta]|uniref:TRUD domain-containing protein n=1 Tax=Fonsecaea erecta TaxID=1367422 RepID=A0A178ZX21_9EURO|nr:hypothetical protein AYL99_00214 [Fonsecaea erecta]OAP64242.1 hypothetical protein AYL99_00214 [Fonsecaea erecta]